MMNHSQQYTPLEQSSTSGVSMESSSFHLQQQQQVSGVASVREEKRPLSGYNVFFILQRKRIIDGESEDDHVITIEEVKEFVENQRIVRNLPQPKRMHRKTHGMIGFREMARLLADKWKKLPPSEKQIYNTCADAEKHRYNAEKERMNHLNNQCNDVITQHSNSDNKQPVFITDDNSCCYREVHYGIESSVGTPFTQMIVQHNPPTTSLQVSEDFEFPPNSDEDNEDIADDVDLSDEIDKSRRVILNNVRMIQYQKAKLNHFKQQQQMQMFVLNQKRKLQFMRSMRMNQQKQQPQSLSSMMYPPTSFDTFNWMVNQQKQKQVPIMTYSSSSNNNWTMVPEMTPSNVMSMNMSMNMKYSSNCNLKTITDDNDVDFSTITTNDDLVDNYDNNYCIDNVLDVADETFDGVTDFLASNDFNNHFKSDTDDVSLMNGYNNNAHEDDLLFEPITNYNLLDFQDDNYCNM